jgi:hypothetical protein
MGTASPGAPPPIWLVYGVLAAILGGPIFIAWTFVLARWP